ncbi:chondroitin AC/alginate lyase [Auriscalpium vulgare]|uniref:Chondroitin AC/alginate lyase n=1 Tax=Auriscalpium vulgare TaxID=40419 RepID=A0ACB8RYJ7_9AGAM|nr:chondroitin AC/alginate lyase [Auriscalpium vulgare]
MRATTALLPLLSGLPAVLSLSGSLDTRASTASQPMNLQFNSYDNAWVDPQYVLSKNWNDTTVVAQQTIVEWADNLNAQGPWSVTTSKPFNASSGDPHDYLSWAPYWFPDCSNVHNTTALTDEQIWVTCPYVSKDGQFNPDRLLVNNTGAFDALSNAVLYNSMAWVINGSSTYPEQVATQIKTWFLDDATRMNPNLNYAQVIRGPPGSQFGSHTGVLDLKGMAKLTSGILILRQGKAPAWTSDIDTGLVAWANTYIQWLTTSDIALGEANSTNNHGSYYYNQLASLQILVNDLTGANATVQKYFSTLYQNQILASGEQVCPLLRAACPLEAVRTRPYHYRSYNLAAMITNARIGAYLGFDAWNLTTATGGTIHAALDFALAAKPDPDGLSEPYQSAGAVASVYGDAQGKYAAFLAQNEPAYPKEPWFFWYQPLSDSGWVRANVGNTTSTSSGGGGSSGTQSKNGAARVGVCTLAAVAAGVVGSLVAFLV